MFFPAPFFSIVEGKEDFFMVESLNSKVEIVVDGTSYAGFAQYGKIMIGNAGFEFYDDKKVSNFVQIPWEEIESVTVSVLFGGKWIPRFSIKTKSDGSFIFAAKEVKAILRAVRSHIGKEKMYRSLSFFQVIKRGTSALFKKKN